MSEDTAEDPVRLVVAVADTALAERLAALLASVPGLRPSVRARQPTRPSFFPPP